MFKRKTKFGECLLQQGIQAFVKNSILTKTMLEIFYLLEYMVYFPMSQWFLIGLAINSPGPLKILPKNHKKLKFFVVAFGLLFPF